MAEQAIDTQETASTPAEAVQGAMQRLEGEVRARKEALAGLRSLAKEQAYEDLEKYKKTLERARKRLGGEGLGIEGLVAELEGYADKAAADAKRRLGRELKALCEAEGISFRVVRGEEPVELRIAPLSVEIDHGRGRARLSFARNVLAECRAEAGEVLKAYRKTLKALDGRFDPAGFFESCWSAYRSTLASLGKKMGERVEILDFLPRLALELQPKRFRVDPRKEHFQDYPRARFAYDVLRLRRAGGLQRDTRRIQLGVATGTSATQKDRVVYLEDEEGRGEYKLTVFFRTDGKATEGGGGGA